MTRRSLLLTLALLLAGALLPASLFAQADYTANGPGSFIAIGVTGSAFQSDYGKTHLLGGAIYLDANLFRRVGIEAEARSLKYNTSDNLRETTYLIGPKFYTHGRSIRPYAKLLAGRGHFNFPYNYAQGSYFVAAPGAGIDYRIGRSPVLLRLIDFEYQIWPNFTYGTLTPYGLSAGLSIRVF